MQPSFSPMKRPLPTKRTQEHTHDEFETAVSPIIPPSHQQPSAKLVSSFSRGAKLPNRLKEAQQTPTIHAGTPSETIIQRVISQQSFQHDAERLNPKGRIGLLSSLRPLLRAINRYEQQSNLAALLDIIQTKAALPSKTYVKYRTALLALQGEIERELSRPFSVMLNDILSLTDMQRRALFENATVRNLIQAKPDNEATGLMGALLVGAFSYWKPMDSKSGYSDYREAVVNYTLGKGLSMNASANCWEFVLYSAQLAGNLSAETLIGLFNAKGWGGQGTYKLLGWEPTLPRYDPQQPGVNEPTIGDIVFLRYLPRDPSKLTVPFHVVLYVGNGRVLSHDSGVNEAATIKDLRFWSQAVFEYTQLG